MQITVRKVHPHFRVTIEIDGELYDVGLLNAEEAKAFAQKLISAAYELLD